MKETRSCVQQLKDLGFKGVILTYAKELVFDHKTQSLQVDEKMKESKGVDSALGIDPTIEEWRVGTLKTVDLIEKDDILAIKCVMIPPVVTSNYLRTRVS